MMAAAGLLIADPSLRTAVRFALEAEGMHVGVYHDMSRLLGEGDDAHCLIIDMPPHQADVAECLQELRHHRANAAVIVLASCPSRRTHEAVSAVGATLVEKPLLTDALCTAIDRLTSARQKAGFADPVDPQPSRQ